MSAASVSTVGQVIIPAGCPVMTLQSWRCLGLHVAGPAGSSEPVFVVEDDLIRPHRGSVSCEGICSCPGHLQRGLRVLQPLQR